MIRLSINRYVALATSVLSRTSITYGYFGICSFRGFLTPANWLFLSSNYWPPSWYTVIRRLQERSAGPQRSYPPGALQCAEKCQLRADRWRISATVSGITCTWRFAAGMPSAGAEVMAQTQASRRGGRPRGLPSSASKPPCSKACIQDPATNSSAATTKSLGNGFGNGFGNGWNRPTTG